ncbi:MAG: addiction module protein [Lacunisphaera sp.]|nr:addiction module protein [Lacunisphaera sp.]
MTRIEALTQEATKLPKEQRLALARVLLDLESTSNLAETEQSWDDEIRARIKAVDEGRVPGIAYDELQKEMDSRYDA